MQNRVQRDATGFGVSNESRREVRNNVIQWRDYAVKRRDQPVMSEDWRKPEIIPSRRQNLYLVAWLVIAWLLLIGRMVGVL